MVGWILAGTALALVLVFFVSRARRYRALFSDAHVLDVARAAAQVKASALGRVIHDEHDLPTSAGDPRIAQTSAGLNIIYTVRREDTQFVHHCSVSVAGYTAHAVGGTFVILIAMIAGLPIEKMGFGIGQSTVHHGSIRLDDAEHVRISTATAELSAERVAELFRSAFSTRSTVTWQRAA